MEAKNTLKDLVYLGVGAVAISAKKVEEYVDELLSKNEKARKEGKDKVEQMKIRASAMLEDLNEQKNEFVKLVSEKTKVAEHEISDFFNDLMEKPGQAKEQQLRKIDDLAHKISAKTEMTVNDVKLRFEDFTDEIHEAQKTLKMKSEKVLEDMREKADDMKESTIDFMHDIDERTHNIRAEVADKMKSALHKLRHTLDLASENKLTDLDKRVGELEKK